MYLALAADHKRHKVPTSADSSPSTALALGEPQAPSGRRLMIVYGTGAMNVNIETNPAPLPMLTA